MDRILTRIDHEGNAVVFLPDTLKDGKLLAWYGQSNSEPVEVPIDYYRSTKELEDKEAQRLKKQYEKVYGNGPVFLMQRFPRGFMKAIKDTIKASNGTVKAPPISEAEKAHYGAAKAVRCGKVWKVLDDQGGTLKILANEQDAMKALERQVTMH